MSEKQIEKTIRNIKATMEFSGFETSPETEDRMRRVLKGEITAEEAIAEIYDYVNKLKNDQ